MLDVWFPALRCGPAGQGFAPGNTMFYGLEHMRLRYHSYMFDGRFGSEHTSIAGAIFWMYFILVLLFRQLCYVYPYCEKVQNIMKNHEKRRYFLNLESTDFKPGVSEFQDTKRRSIIMARLNILIRTIPPSKLPRRTMLLPSNLADQFQN